MMKNTVHLYTDTDAYVTIQTPVKQMRHIEGVGFNHLMGDVTYQDIDYPVARLNGYWTNILKMQPDTPKVTEYVDWQGLVTDYGAKLRGQSTIQAGYIDLHPTTADVVLVTQDFQLTKMETMIGIVADLNARYDRLHIYVEYKTHLNSADEPGYELFYRRQHETL